MHKKYPVEFEIVPFEKDVEVEEAEKALTLLSWLQKELPEATWEIDPAFFYLDGEIKLQGGAEQEAIQALKRWANFLESEITIQPAIADLKICEAWGYCDGFSIRVWALTGCAEPAHQAGS